MIKWHVFYRIKKGKITMEIKVILKEIDYENYFGDNNIDVKNIKGKI